MAKQVYNAVAVGLFIQTYEIPCFIFLKPLYNCCHEELFIVVQIHFSETGRETMSDKIKRMLRNEIAQM